MKEFIDKLIGRLEEEKQRLRKLKNDTITLSDSEVIAIEEGAYDFCKKIVNELAEEYIPCTKPCTDCEAYDLVKHNCPKFCKVIKETVEELAEEYNNGWIPCSNKLPDKYGEYLCCDKYGEYIIGYPTARVSSDDYYVETEHEIMNNCIAWQPLPEAYKG